MKANVIRLLVLGFVMMHVSVQVFSQDFNRFNWVSVGQDGTWRLQGKLEDTSLTASLYRLPASAKAVVRKEVWNLSRNPAGVYLDFYTEADTVAFAYRCEQNINLKHMSAIGISGIDVYAKLKDNRWVWVKTKYIALNNDDVKVVMEGLDVKDLAYYRLYFPLYNTVADFKIGLNRPVDLISLENKGKPIVVYGTSITQGASASRAGMSWTALLGRRVEMPVVNLGFSANGRLEKEIVDVIAKQEASLYIIDCLPNLVVFTDEEVRQRLLYTWQTLRKSHPQTPIIFAEHADATINLLNTDSQRAYERVNRNLNRFIVENITGKDAHVHLVTAQSIGLDIDDTADGIHPSDRGMKKYADAYEKVIRDLRIKVIN